MVGRQHAGGLTGLGSESTSDLGRQAHLACAKRDPLPLPLHRSYPGVRALRTCVPSWRGTCRPPGKAPRASACSDLGERSQLAPRGRARRVSLPRTAGRGQRTRRSRPWCRRPPPGTRSSASGRRAPLPRKLRRPRRDRTLGWCSPVQHRVTSWIWATNSE
jgi:hypothetical protein